ncbi:uncharacterized protein LOC128730836 [Anopheles nili]|uniref:uncharacterized protein LOC128730836 n=1 Tax=Anopheles nili TaxID=185578 RepID=UPI00237B9759|nr:uncharacterized protein LOC128730836 [Anopheles nili]
MILLSIKQATFVFIFIAVRTHIIAHGTYSDAALSQKRFRNTSYNLRITKMQCLDAPYKATYLNHCYMEQFPNGTSGLNISITIPMVLNYLGITVKVYYKYSTYRPFMINWNMDYCQGERNGKYNPSTALVMKIISETLPDFSYPCPHGNRTYECLWMFAPKYIPQTLPSGDYRMDVFFKNWQEITLVAVQMFCSVRKQGIIG